MGRNWLKLLLFGFALGFGVFYGLEVATNGIERIHGPTDGAAVQQTSGSAKPTAGAGAARGGKETPAPTMTAATARQVAAAHNGATGKPLPEAAVSEGQPTLLGKLFDAIGEVLKRLAEFALRAVVALFDSILG